MHGAVKGPSHMVLQLGHHRISAAHGLKLCSKMTLELKFTLMVNDRLIDRRQRLAEGKGSRHGRRRSLPWVWQSLGLETGV